MEHVGRWLTLHSNVSAMEISQAYLEHLRNLEQRGLNTKDDPLEASRRALKSWFLDCHREYRFGNLLTDHLFALLTKDRARIMTAVFIMTRAQTYGWQVNSNLPEQERGSSDEADFVALEQVVADKYGFPPPQPSGSLESALRAHALLLRPDNGVQNNAPPAARV